MRFILNQLHLLDADLDAYWLDCALQSPTFVDVVQPHTTEYITSGNRE